VTHFIPMLKLNIMGLISNSTSQSCRGEIIVEMEYNIVT
jgi:hypothetical protein